MGRHLAAIGHCSAAIAALSRAKPVFAGRGKGKGSGISSTSQVCGNYWLQRDQLRCHFASSSFDLWPGLPSVRQAIAHSSSKLLRFLWPHAGITIRSSGPLRWVALSSYALWQRPLTSSVSPHMKLYWSLAIVGAGFSIASCGGSTTARAIQLATCEIAGANQSLVHSTLPEGSDLTSR